MTLQRIEAELKREITATHKETIGKGPSKTSIKIFENTILIKLQDALSTFELSASQVVDEGAKIKEIRSKLLDEFIYRFIKLISKYEECSLQDSLSTTDVSKGEVYILLILDKDIESCFKKSI